jgi:hypothetical protein
MTRRKIPLGKYCEVWRGPYYAPPHTGHIPVALAVHHEIRALLRLAQDANAS